jgi:cytochrome c-type biogenesis protein CcmH/NrfG
VATSELSDSTLADAAPSDDVRSDLRWLVPIWGVVWASVVAVAGYLAGESYQALESSLGLAANIMLGVTILLVLALWLRMVLRHRRELRVPAPAEATPAESQVVPGAH